jgi:uncharacterized protein (DUF952 family)
MVTSAIATFGLNRRLAADTVGEHDPESARPRPDRGRTPVFGKDHASTIGWSALTIREKVIPLRKDPRRVPTIYKICPIALWREAERAGTFAGSPVDRRDGYIHFSSAEQVAETAARHFAGQDDLVLIAVDADVLGAALKWEPSRDGALFPHLYGALPVAAVTSVAPLRLKPDGRHVLPKVRP